MNPSDACYALVRKAEGVRFKAYQDGGGVWTVGIGHTKGVTSATTCSSAQAEAWLEADMADAVAAVNRLALPCTQDQFDALCSFTFNEGSGKFSCSTLLHLHKGKSFNAAAAEFGKWVLCAGEIEGGLVKRRAREALLYLGEDA